MAEGQSCRSVAEDHSSRAEVVRTPVGSTGAEAATAYLVAARRILGREAGLHCGSPRDGRPRLGGQLLCAAFFPWLRKKLSLRLTDPPDGRGVAVEGASRRSPAAVSRRAWAKPTWTPMRRGERPSTKGLGKAGHCGGRPHHHKCARCPRLCRESPVTRAATIVVMDNLRSHKEPRRSRRHPRGQSQATFFLPAYRQISIRLNRSSQK